MIDDRCTTWAEIERATDGETNAAGRIAAARHVRTCAACRRTLREHMRVRRSLRLTFPLASIDPAISARVQAVLMFQRNAALQTWLRRCTAVAAAVLVVCTLSATFAHSDSTQSTDDSLFVAPVIDRETDTPQHVTQWIVQDLSRSR